MSECDHNLQIEHTDIREYPSDDVDVEVWVACRNCDAYFEGVADMERTDDA